MKKSTDFPRLKDPKEIKPKASFTDKLFNALNSGYTLIAFGVVLIILYAIVIYFTEEKVKKQIDDVLVELNSNGFGVSYKISRSFNSSIGGLYIDDLSLTAPANMGGWEFKSSRIPVQCYPLIRKVTFNLSGTHSLDAKTIKKILLVVNDARLVVTDMDHRDYPEMTFNLRGLTAASPASMIGFGINFLNFKFVPNELKYTYDFKLYETTLPAYMKQHLPKKMEYLSLVGDVKGFSESRKKPLLVDWWENNGIVNVSAGEIIWSPFMSKFNGTFSFDNHFDVSGSGMGTFYNLFTLIDAYEKASYIKQSSSSMAKIVLGNQLTRKKGESQDSISAPINYQNKAFSIGPVRLD
ncbi:MAG: DUF2125 domain-containing protein [Alphaproteobacteria bacterium]|nr:DUF2125 domain-containing protein [Alphaproteobacteria bacterium]